jgi:cytochrome P450
MKRKYPNGPKISFPRALIAQMFPSRYPYDPLAFNLTLARDFGDVAYFRLGPLRVYQVNHPDLIREILVEQASKFNKPGLLKSASRRMLGQGLLTSDGELWKQQRKLIQPAFRHERLATVYGDVMSAHARQLAISFSDSDVRDIGDDMGKLTLAIVVKSLFGENLARSADSVGELLTAVAEAANERMNSALQLPSWIPTRRNRRESHALVRLDAIISELISARRKSGAQRDDLLSVLLTAVDAETGIGMTDRQLRDEMMTLFLAGQDTTANALTWTWYLLARNPAVEEKLQEELRRVLAGRAPLAADLPQLPYTDMIIREAMRLFPPAPIFARQPVEDVTVGEWQMPKGSLIIVSVYALHRDPRFFPEPERFMPARFAPGWEERILRYAYLPFGGGPRVCIGNGFAMMEARLILATMAQRWKLSLESGAEIAPKQLVTLRPSRAVRVRVEKRLPCE